MPQFKLSDIHGVNNTSFFLVLTDYVAWLRHRFQAANGYQCSIEILLLKGCGMEAESPVKLCALASVPDLQRTARTAVEQCNEQ